MALGIKKVKLPENPAEEPIVEDVPDESVADAIAQKPATDPVEDAADEAMLGALAEGPDTEAADEAEDASGTDALLDMFSSVGVHQVDRTMLVGLAGDVDMDDLISELGIVAAALGIVVSDRPKPAQPEALAAAA